MPNSLKSWRSGIAERLLRAAVLLPFLLAGVLSPAAETEALRIADATGGAPLDAVRLAAMEIAQEELPQTPEISMIRRSAAEALTGFRAGKFDAVILEVRAIPSDFAGLRFPWAAEALVCYVSADNPLASHGLSGKNVREIWKAQRPTWRSYNGRATDIQRIGLAKKGDGVLEQKFLEENQEKSEIFRVLKLEQGFLFLTIESLFCGPYWPERSPQVVVLPIDGIRPDTASISSRRYPFALRYEIITDREPSSLCRKWLERLKKQKFSGIMRDGGLLPLLPGEEKTGGGK